MDGGRSYLPKSALQPYGQLRAARVTRVLAAGVALTALLVVIQTLMQWVDFHYFDLNLRVFDSNHHASVFGVLSLLAQAGAAAAVALRAKSSPQRRPWLVLAALVAALVVVRGVMPDRAVMLAPVAGGIFLLLCWLTSEDPAAIRAVTLGALLLLFVSFAMHAAGLSGNAGPGTEYDSWGYQLPEMLKHSAEFAGWMLLGIAMAAVSTVAPKSAHRPEIGSPRSRQRLPVEQESPPRVRTRPGWGMRQP
jgi:hypothetical protein